MTDSFTDPARQSCSTSECSDSDGNIDGMDGRFTMASAAADIRCCYASSLVFTDIGGGGDMSGGGVLSGGGDGGDAVDGDSEMSPPTSECPTGPIPGDPGAGSGLFLAGGGSNELADSFLA